LASHSLLLRIYDKLVLTRPITALIFTFLVIGIFAFHLPQFKLDASGDSLVLENDADLRYYRRIAERYGTNRSYKTHGSYGRDQLIFWLFSPGFEHCRAFP